LAAVCSTVMAGVSWKAQCLTLRTRMDCYGEVEHCAASGVQGVSTSGRRRSVTRHGRNVAHQACFWRIREGGIADGFWPGRSWTVAAQYDENAGGETARVGGVMSCRSFLAAISSSQRDAGGDEFDQDHPSTAAGACRSLRVLARQVRRGLAMPPPAEAVCDSAAGLLHLITAFLCAVVLARKPTWTDYGAGHLGDVLTEPPGKTPET